MGGLFRDKTGVRRAVPALDGACTARRLAGEIFCGRRLRDGTRAPLRSRIEAAGFRPARAFYFNYLLFIPIWLARRLVDALKIELKSEGEINTPLLNRVLSFIFTCDISSAAVLRPPFGVSILLLASKSGG